MQPRNSCNGAPVAPGRPHPGDGPRWLSLSESCFPPVYQRIEPAIFEKDPRPVLRTNTRALNCRKRGETLHYFPRRGLLRVTARFGRAPARAVFLPRVLVLRAAPPPADA